MEKVKYGLAKWLHDWHPNLQGKVIPSAPDEYCCSFSEVIREKDGELIVKRSVQHKYPDWFKPGHRDDKLGLFNEKQEKANKIREYLERLVQLADSQASHDVATQALKEL